MLGKIFYYKLDFLANDADYPVIIISPYKDKKSCVTNDIPERIQEYLYLNDFAEELECIFDIPDCFDESKFIKDMKVRGYIMEKGIF